MGDVIPIDIDRGPWRNVTVHCGACGRRCISSQQANRDGTYRSHGLACGGANGCGADAMLVLQDLPDE